MAAYAKRPWEASEHRCDRCGAESWFRLTKLTFEGSVLQLFFCHHHGNRYTPAMINGWFIENYTGQLLPT